MPSESIVIGNDLEMEKEIEAELREKESQILKKRLKKIEEEADLYKIHENFYLAPVKNYLKYKKKRFEYKRLYHHSKMRYYLSIKFCMIEKMVRKHLFSKVIYSVALSLASFVLLSNTKWGIALKELASSYWDSVLNYFKSLGQ